MTNPGEPQRPAPANLKRYDLVEYGGYYRDHHMEASDDGEWVRFDDVAADLLALRAAPQETPPEIRAEVQDKLSVYAIAERSPIPLHKAAVQRQCEDFLVELFERHLAARLTVPRAPHLEEHKEQTPLSRVDRQPESVVALPHRPTGDE